MISLSIFSFLFVYLIQRLQGYLPLNPMGFSTAQAPSNATPMTPDLAFNTAVSFMTNTNWQSYSPDTTMSYFDADGCARGPELRVCRGRNRCGRCADSRVCAAHRQDDRKLLGRCDALHALYPAAHFASWRRCSSSGRDPFRTSRGLPRQRLWKARPRLIEQGPLASQLAIKMLGTNGGGYFNANSSHPYENPTPLSNLLQMLLIFSLGRRTDVHVRQDGARHAPGLGDLRNDVRDVSGGRFHLLLGGAARKSDDGQAWASRAPIPEASRAATWKARKSVSAIR